MGRTPIPDNVRALRGNPGKRKAPARVRHVQAAPTPPSYLKGEALAEWKRIVPELERMGLLARLDRAILYAYCEWWARYLKLSRKLDDEVVPGRNSAGKAMVKNVLWPPYRDACDKFVQLAKELGLTPAARLRMKPGDKDEREDTDLD